MLESKKKMAQSFSDLKVAMEKGRGTPKEIFLIFEQGCREFAQETQNGVAVRRDRWPDRVGRGAAAALDRRLGNHGPRFP